MRFLIVAVDGVLADTLPARAGALHSAAESLGLALGRAVRDEWIAGMSFTEAARVATARISAADETMTDLLALAAERTLQQHAAQHAPVLFPDALARCAEAAVHGWRVILRTDATRRVAGPLLEHLLTETNASRAIACDDVRAASSDVSMLQRQYALMAPLLLGATSVSTVEASPHARETVVALMPELRLGWPAA